MEKILASFREWKERKAYLQYHLYEATPPEVQRLLQENLDLAALLPWEVFANDSPRVCDLRQALKEIEESSDVRRLVNLCQRWLRNIDAKLPDWTKQ
jgi:hypothetical protein